MMTELRELQAQISIAAKSLLAYDEKNKELKEIISKKEKVLIALVTKNDGMLNDYRKKIADLWQTHSEKVTIEFKKLEGKQREINQLKSQTERAESLLAVKENRLNAKEERLDFLWHNLEKNEKAFKEQKDYLSVLVGRIEKRETEAAAEEERLSCQKEILLKKIKEYGTKSNEVKTLERETLEKIIVLENKIRKVNLDEDRIAFLQTDLETEKKEALSIIEKANKAEKQFVLREDQTAEGERRLRGQKEGLRDREIELEAKERSVQYRELRVNKIVREKNIQAEIDEMEKEDKE